MGIHLKYVEDPERESDTDVTGTNVKNRELNVFEKFSDRDCRLVLYLFFSITILENTFQVPLLNKRIKMLVLDNKASSENIYSITFVFSLFEQRQQRPRHS